MDDAADAGDSGVQDYSDLYEAAGAKHNVDPALLRTIVQQESRGNANTPNSPKGAVGLAQIMPATAKKLGVDPKNPAQAIDGAAQLLAESLDRNNGDVGQAVAEYHGGPDRKIWGPKTAAYQKSVMAAYQAGAPAAQSGPSDDDVLAMASGNAPSAPAAPPTASTQSDDEVLKIAAGGGAGAEFMSAGDATPKQKGFIQQQIAGGLHDEDQPIGSERHPYFESASHPMGGTPAGAFVVDKDGVLHKMPGGPKDSSFVAGLGQGVGDVGATLSHLMPGSDDSDLKNALLAQQKIYGAKYGGDTASGAGRFLGQLGASAPFLAGGEALAAPVMGAAGPVGTFLAGNAGKVGTGFGRFLTRGASLAASGAQTGAAAAALTSSANEGSLPQQMAEGAVGGGVVGPLAEGAGAALANRIVGAGKTVAPEVADLAKTAMTKYGIPLRTTQVQGVADRSAAVHDSEMISRAGTGYAKNNAAQRQAFTQAVAKTFGSDADKLTPDVMQAAKTRIGGQFDQVAANTNISNASVIADKLNKVVTDAAQVLPDSDVAPLKKQVENITSAIKNDTLTGGSYQALTRKGSPLDRAMESGNPNIRSYAQDLRGVLDDALEGSASPEDATALKQARWQYKNLMTIKNLAAKAGVTGEISPALLNGAVNTSFKNRAFQGAGDLGELAQIGQTFMKEPPNSGTAPRIADLIKGAALGGGGVADAAIALHDPILAAKLLGGAATIGALRYGTNRVVGAMNRSPAAVSRLISNAPNPVLAPTGSKVGAAVKKVLPATAGLLANRLISPQ